MNMNNPTLRRALVIGALVLSSLAILVSVIGIGGVWYANAIANTMMNDLTDTIEAATLRVEQPVARLETNVQGLRAQVNTVQQAVSQISQNVNDEGLIRTLLPEAQEERLDSAIGRIVETVNTVREVYTTALDLYRSVNRLPFVSLPAPSNEAIETLTQNVNAIQQDINDLRVAVANVRARQANAIERVNGINARVDSRLDGVEQQLTQVRALLDGIRTRVLEIRAQVSNLLFLVALVATLFLAWVIYTQVLVIQLMWQKYQTLSGIAGNAK